MLCIVGFVGFVWFCCVVWYEGELAYLRIVLP